MQWRPGQRCRTRLLVRSGHGPTGRQGHGPRDGRDPYRLRSVGGVGVGAGLERCHSDPRQAQADADGASEGRPGFHQHCYPDPRTEWLPSSGLTRSSGYWRATRWSSSLLGVSPRFFRDLLSPPKMWMSSTLLPSRTISAWPRRWESWRRTTSGSQRNNLFSPSIRAPLRLGPEEARVRHLSRDEPFDPAGRQIEPNASRLASMRVHLLNTNCGRVDVLRTVGKDLATDSSAIPRCSPQSRLTLRFTRWSGLTERISIRRFCIIGPSRSQLYARSV